MSKFVLFSDYHLHMFEDMSKPQTYNFQGEDIEVTDRLVAHIETLNSVFDIANREGADVIFAGDFFHARGSVNTLIYNLGFATVAENMKKYPNMMLFMLVGNHDQKDATQKPMHSLEPFKEIPNVYVMDELQSFTVRGHVNIYPVPYSEDTEYLKEGILRYKAEQEGTGGRCILVAHLGVDGSEVGEHRHRLSGAFSLSDLFPDTFDYVAVGHYHKRQQLGGRDNAFYVGNTIQCSFSDEGQAKGVMLIDTEKEGKPKFIEIKNKEFRTLKEINENTQEIVDNHFVRFILPQDLAQEVEIYKDEGSTMRVEVTREYTTDTRIDISVESTEASIVEAYTKKFYPNATELAKEILAEAMSS